MTELKNLNVEFTDEDTDIYDGTGSELEEEDIDPEEEDINEPFDPTKIRVDTRPMTIDLVLSRIKYEELDLAPDFQRHPGIWTNAAKSRLIESVLIRIPLPAFYMDATDEDKWLVVDGLQRLTALKRFVIDKELKLSGLQYLTDIEGKTYDELPRKYQRRIQETQLTVYLIEKGTPPEVKFNIYKRINTGGLPLSLQEIRHALNQGKAAQFLARLAESPEFKEATDIRDWRKKRMGDREFVLRFLAFILTPYTDYNAKSLESFLNDTMAELNKMSEQALDSLEHKFIQAMVAAFDIFGKQAFRKISPEKRAKKNTINKALFEAWSVNLSHLSEQETQILYKRKQDLIEKFINLTENDDLFKISISQGTSKVTQVKYRFSTIQKLIQEVLS